MDPVTHGLAGIVIARAGFSRRLNKWGPITGGLTALFPDSDFILRFFGEEVFLRYHRGVTNSLLLLPVYSLILAYIFQEDSLKNVEWEKWPESPYIDKALKLSGVEFYIWFARFPVVMEKIKVNGNHLVKFVDLRFDVQMGRVPFT